MSRQQYVDVLSYILKVNGIPAGRTELSGDVQKLQPIVIQEKSSP
jgi:hypothetical protein